jgi:ABC-type multidrug transport system fused ATPase/permease subunit
MKKLNNLFDKTFLKYLWLSLAPQKGRVILTIICSLFNGVASIAGISAFLPIIVIIRGGDYAKLREFPFLGQFISLLPLNTDQAVTILALGILAIIVVRSIFSAWINLLQIEILIFVEQIWQEKVMNHWLDMDPLRHSRENRAEVMNLCGSELRNAGRAGGSFILLISSIVQVSLIVSFMLITSWQVVTGIFGFVLLVMVPISFSA